nr:MAG TPA: hypothetical protein [Caudoviricetes sp.]
MFNPHLALQKYNIFRKNIDISVCNNVFIHKNSFKNSFQQKYKI